MKFYFKLFVYENRIVGNFWGLNKVKTTIQK